MYASKLSFSHETKMKLTSPALSKSARMKLRKQRVLEFIRETVGGECQKIDLIAAAGYDVRKQQEYANGWAMVTNMIKKGTITMNDGSDPKNSYVKQFTIPADVHSHQITNNNGEMTVPEGDGEISIATDGAEHAQPRQGFPEGTFPEMPQLEPVIPTRPSRIVLEYAHKVSAAAEVLKGYTNDEELSAYRSGLLKAVELLQDAQ